MGLYQTLACTIHRKNRKVIKNNELKYHLQIEMKIPVA